MIGSFFILSPLHLIFYVVLICIGRERGQPGNWIAQQVA